MMSNFYESNIRAEYARLRVAATELAAASTAMIDKLAEYSDSADRFGMVLYRLQRAISLVENVTVPAEA